MSTSLPSMLGTTGLCTSRDGASESPASTYVPPSGTMGIGAPSPLGKPAYPEDP
jgi:hypothetical protein